MEIRDESWNAAMRIRCIRKEQEHHSGAILKQQAEPEGITNRIHSLEEEVATMRQQILIAKARAALAE